MSNYLKTSSFLHANLIETIALVVKFLKKNMVKQSLQLKKDIKCQQKCIRKCHLMKSYAANNRIINITDAFQNIYILGVVVLDETKISGCLHFSMQNIEMSCYLDRASRWSNVNVSQF